MPLVNRFPPSYGSSSQSDFGRPTQVNDPTFVGYNQFRQQPSSGSQGLFSGIGNNFQMPSWLQGLIGNAGFGGIFGQNQQPSPQQQQQAFGQHLPVFSSFGSGMGGGMSGPSPQQGLRGFQGGAGSPDMRQISGTGQFVNWSGRPGPGPPGLMGLGNPAVGRGMAGGNPYQISRTGVFTTATGPQGQHVGGFMTRPAAPGGGGAAGQASPFGGGTNGPLYGGTSGPLQAAVGPTAQAQSPLPRLPNQADWQNGGSPFSTQSSPSNPNQALTQLQQQNYANASPGLRALMDSERASQLSDPSIIAESNPQAAYQATGNAYWLGPQGAAQQLFNMAQAQGKPPNPNMSPTGLGFSPFQNYSFGLQNNQFSPSAITAY